MRTYTLGSWRGVTVRVHPTFAILALLLVFQFGQLVDRGVAGYLFASLLIGLLFGCVLLHEFGHALMAMQYGIGVQDITLWPIGGVARIEHIPERPKAETLVAIAGPAVNLAITLATVPLLALYAAARGYALDDLLREAANDVTPVSLLVFLALFNVVLLGFNLLPAFPMDGGRILRASLATAMGRERATRVAVVVGQVLAVALAVAGLWFQVWSLPLVGVFVILAAQAEWRAMRLESAMRRLRVGQFALWDMGGLSPEHPLTFALRGGPRDWVVTRRGRVVGMIWRHQLLHGFNEAAGQRTVGDVMDRDVVVADIDDSVYDVQRWMNEADRWAIPVTEDGTYRGIFTADRFVHVYRQIQPPLADQGSHLLASMRRALRGADR